MKPPPVEQRLLALFVGGCLLFDFPLLRLALAEGTLFGLPRGPLLIFGAWALLLVLLAVLMESGGGGDEGDDGDGG